MRNFRLTLAYDGTRYHGFQRQGNTDNTIQGHLEDALSAILGVKTEIFGSGRTDAGVHAVGQVANFHAETELSADELLRRLRAALPLDIGAMELTEAEPRFHARLSATGKTYRYRIWNSEAPCVFERRYVHVLPKPLDRAAMEAALPCFLGEHDFRGFCSNPGMKKSTVRRIDAISLERIGEELRLTVSGNGFLYNMVRLIAGTLIRVGLHELRVEDVAALIETGERAGMTAPACGLCLMEVRYE